LTSPITGYTYDYAGRVITVTDPLTHTTQYAYDADNLVTGVTDQLSNVTTYARDHLGRVTSVTQPDPDGAGALTSPESPLTSTMPAVA
jgi:YD repeat-containing protein